MEFSQDVNHRPIIFIRFNPDDYISDGIKNNSCWKINNIGICILNKKYTKEWKERLISLKSQIDYWCNPENKTDKTIEIIELYFDK